VDATRVVQKRLARDHLNSSEVAGHQCP
jgi:hypothetical protein